MTTDKLEARIRYTKQAIAEVNDALALLVEQMAVKQLRIDAWYANSHSKLTRRKTSLAAKLAATKRAKQRNKTTAPRTDTLVSIVETDSPMLSNPK